MWNGAKAGPSSFQPRARSVQSPEAESGLAESIDYDIRSRAKQIVLSKLWSVRR